MKVLIGVCGIGKGHSTRQIELANELRKRGHEVRIFTFSNGVRVFNDSKFITYEVFVPFIKFNGTKFDYIDIFKKNYNKYFSGIRTNNKIFKKLEQDDFIPDICVSDYEPVVAKFAYKHNIPLINIDQQSKFIYMTDDDINNYSCVEEKKRLTYFFPKFNYKYIISFYKIKDELPSNVELVPPIIKQEVIINNKLKKDNSVIVYFSKYGDISIEQSLNEVLKLFSSFKKYKFILYTEEETTCSYENVEIKKVNEKTFSEDLGKCCAVITTAGQTLISECYYCGIPVFVIPLPTFDQHYCGKFIAENELGISSYRITEDNITEFLNNLEIYTKNINNNDNIIKMKDTVKYLADELEKYNNQNNK